MNEYYTLLETAKIFNVKVRTVREWLRIGKLHAEKYGRTWAVSSAEIDRLRANLLSKDESDYYTIAELADLEGVSISTVRRWLHNGLQHEKPIGKKEVYIPSVALLAIAQYRHT